MSSAFESVNFSSLDSIKQSLDYITGANTIKIAGPNKYEPKKWWCSEEEKLLRLRNAARQKFDCTKRYEDARKTLAAEKTLQNFIRNKKISIFQTFVEEISKSL